MGAGLLKTLMGQLQDLVTKLQGFQGTKKSEPASTAAAAENFQDGSDLFLELNQSPAVEASEEQVGKSSAFIHDFYLTCVFAQTMTNTIMLISIFRLSISNVGPFLFRSLFRPLAQSSNIRVWISGFWLWSRRLCLLIL